MKKTLVSAAVISALGFAQAASAVPGVFFDETGTSGAGILVDTFSWFADNALLFAGSGAGGTSIILGNRAKILVVGELNNATHTTGPGTVNAQDGSNFFTYEMSIPITVVDNGMALVLTFDTTRAGGAEDFFRMFNTAADPSQSAGTGYGTASTIVGTQILEATTRFFGNMSLNYNFVDDVPGLYDRLKEADPNGNLVPTLEFGGSRNINLEVESQNSAYFRTPLETLGFDMQLVQQAFGAPFPTTSMPVVASGYQGNTANLGAAVAATTVQNNNLTTSIILGATLNNNSCDLGGGRDGLLATNDCDVRLNTGAGEMSILANVLPEPGSLALMGLSLGALGFIARRRRRAA